MYLSLVVARLPLAELSVKIYFWQSVIRTGLLVNQGRAYSARLRWAGEAL